VRIYPFILRRKSGDLIGRVIFMSDVMLAESIYVKRSTSKFGGGGTSRQSVIETFWFPLIAKDGYVELYPVSDDLQRVLKLVEKIPDDLFKDLIAAGRVVWEVRFNYFMVLSYQC
jgi:hypothetical protein